MSRHVEPAQYRNFLRCAECDTSVMAHIVERNGGLCMACDAARDRVTEIAAWLRSLAGKRLLRPDASLDDIVPWHVAMSLAAGVERGEWRA